MQLNNTGDSDKLFYDDTFTNAGRIYNTKIC